MNKKIINATQTTAHNIKFKSFLEKLIYGELTKQGFHPKYEATKYEIWEGYRPTVPFFDRNPKTRMLRRNDTKVISITYTPDFEFDYNGMHIIIEAKGFENDVFPVKKKLFRKYLEEHKDELHPLYFEIYTKRQLLQAIEIIKNYEGYTTN